MASKLDKLLSIRSRLIGDLDHHVAEIHKFDSESDKALITFRTSALERTFKDFMELNEKLERMSSYHELENLTEIANRNRVLQDKYLSTKMKVNQLAESDALGVSFDDVASNRRSTYFDLNERSEPTSPTHQGIRLAYIQLTPFHGAYEAWPEFKDSFLSVMKKYRGDNVEKFAHLKNYLRGYALDLIKHLPLTNDSYDQAWSLLKQEWENKNAIIEAYLEKIYSLPQLQAQVASTIRTAISTTKGCLAGIKNMEIMTETWDPLIIFLLKKKLAHELRGKWEEERKGSFESPKLKEFLSFLDLRSKIAVTTPRKVMPKQSSNELRQRVFQMSRSTDTNEQQGSFETGHNHPSQEVPLEDELQEDMDEHIL